MNAETVNGGSVTKKNLNLSPEVEITLVEKGGFLLGIGTVCISGVQVRSGEVPIRPDFSTPDAIHYQDFRLVGVEQSASGIVLHTEAVGRPEIYGEMMDEYSYNLAFPRLRKIQNDRLDWLLAPAKLSLDGQDYVGLSIGFHFTGSSEIHKLSLVSTWEIGGVAAGNTIYHQSYTCPPVYEATHKNHFSTTCLKRLDLWNSWGGHSYQMLPRWGCIQPFDFQSSKEGVLLGYWPGEHSVKSLIQKNSGEDVIFVLDEYDFPLTMEADIPAKHILFSPGSRPKHEVIDMWTRACDYTAEIICGFFGIKPCQPMTGGGPEYKGRNSVSREQLADGPQPDWLWTHENGKFYFRLEGEKIERRDFLYWLADNKIPELHARGLKRVWFEPVHESDFTEDAFAFHAQTGWHGDLTVCSICGSRRYVPAECYDGWRGWNYLASAARKYKMSLGHWVGLHLTPRAPILREHPEYILRHVNTLGHSGGYSHLSICSINWCSGAKQWFLDDMKRWHDEGGLEWLFFDSWPNLGCSPLNYGGRMEPMQWELGDVLAQLQKIGYNWFSFEGTSPFGVHQYGLWDPMQEYEKHTSGGVMGQNDFSWWIGHEYMGYNQTLGPGINQKRDRSTLPEISFRYAANRSLTLVQEDHNNRYPYVEGLDRTCSSMRHLLVKRFLLPDDCGVRWESPEGQALFAFRAFDFKIPSGFQVSRVVAGVKTPVAGVGRVLRTEPLTAYELIKG
jgi:hypothetical protein